MANNNRVIVPAARAALDQFKMEAAIEFGGQMVKKMIQSYENGMK